MVVMVINAYGQDAPPPEYLVAQDFPDSVRNQSVQTLKGEQITFSKMLELHKGKKVVIDIWASWCRDCIVGLPTLEKLKKKTGTDNVAYIFISIDKDQDKWKSAIDRFGIVGDHYRIETGWENALAYYIELDWVPRYLVLNERGSIIVPKAVSAGDKALGKALKD